MPRKYVRHRPKPEHKLPYGTIEAIRQLLKQDVGPSKIARLMGVGRMTVWRVAKKMKE